VAAQSFIYDWAQFTEVRGKRNSRKFTVASNRSDAALSTRQQHGGTPSASKRSDLVAGVAPLCIKGLRLVTMQLPENSRPSDQDAAELRLDGVLRSSSRRGPRKSAREECGEHGHRCQPGAQREHRHENRLKRGTVGINPSVVSPQHPGRHRHRIVLGIPSHLLPA
jgi:hypothetical protein